MQYPLVDREWLTGLRFFHGIYNGVVMVLFLYHGWTGWLIRRARTSKQPLPFPLIKRHRTMGPVLAGAGIGGFFIGFGTVMLHTGKALEYPYHLAGGLSLVLFLTGLYFLGIRIKGPDSFYRSPHFTVGVLVLALYFAQAVIGLRLLFFL